MAGITLAQAEAQLALYLAAESKVLNGQSVEIAGRKLTRADLGAIQTGISSWNDRVRQLTAAAGARGRARTVVVGG